MHTASRKKTHKKEKPKTLSTKKLSFKEQKELEKALKCYQCALKIDPLFADALSNIGNIFFLSIDLQQPNIKTGFCLHKISAPSAYNSVELFGL